MNQFQIQEYYSVIVKYDFLFYKIYFLYDSLVRWRDTDYEAPKGTTELEAIGQRAYTVLLYGQALGECRLTVCLGNICTDASLHVVASVVLTPATAFIAPGDTVRYK